jgi:hypothetical protein
VQWRSLFSKRADYAERNEVKIASVGKLKGLVLNHMPLLRNTRNASAVFDVFEIQVVADEKALGGDFLREEGRYTNGKASASARPHPARRIY